MVQGPCRGKMCDFWARVKLRKRATEEIAQDMYLSICQCDNPGHTKLDDRIVEYWTVFGVKNIGRLCEEEPDLCSKMKQIEYQVGILMS
ncbi:MAG: hypothetical protein ACFFEX_07115 [Candidatus Thorarchaeota archaeon]